MGKVIVDFENGRQCNFCELWFTRPWCLKQHLPKCEVKNKLYDESKIKFECRFCYKNFKMKRFLRNHEDIHRDITTKPYSCFYIGCKKVFMDRIAANGCETMHKELFKCEICGMCKRGKTELKRHMEGHNQLRFIYKCEECDVGTFVTEKSLVRHRKNVHCEAKQFKCEVCRRPLASKDSLAHHMKRNHKNFFLKCNKCPKIFRFQINLDSHIEKIHTEKDNPFGCVECGVTLKSAGGLKSHKEIHTETREFQCSECHAKFRRKWSLDIHVLIHKGEYPHKCDSCEKMFRTGSGLTVHKKRVHEKVPRQKYPCEYCVT